MKLYALPNSYKKFMKIGGKFCVVCHKFPKLKFNIMQIFQAFFYL